MQKRWIVRPPDSELQDILWRELNISRLTAQLLINRGLVDLDKASVFLSPNLKNLHDPFRMMGMDRAVSRIIDAIRSREQITIYGDYDVDGTTATALLYLFFKEIDIPAGYYIPERLRHGYGLNNQSIKEIHDGGTRLLITTDCGVSNYDEVMFANSLGLDVIITDHHEVPEKLPPAYAILNPKQAGCGFPFKELAGVGVAFNLIIAIRARLRETGHFPEGIPNLKNYTDIVALGTIADMVPLIDENRILVKYGLDELTAGRRPGIKALKDVSAIGDAVRTHTVAFQLAPRINAAGRLDKASTGVRLLITDDEREAMNIARQLDRENIDRQGMEKDILHEAIRIVEDEAFAINEKKAIVLAREGWHPGIIGIVASRLVDRYHKPAVIISLKDGVGKGSARGIKRFSILAGLKGCEKTLEKYGGHKMAAGLTIMETSVREFESMFYELAGKTLEWEDLVPEITLDSYIQLGDLNEHVVTELTSLAPFGLANPEPLLGAKDAHISQSEIVGNNHLRFKIKQTDPRLKLSETCFMWNGIAYGMGGRHPLRGGGYDIAFMPYIEEWSGNRSLKLKIKEVKKGEE